MKSFSIDRENNITAFDGNQPSEDAHGESFGSEAELQKLTACWPTSRLIETWNSIPGFTPVKRFTDRKTAVARIWKAIQSLEGGGGALAAHVALGIASSRKKPAPAQKGGHVDTRRTPAKKAGKIPRPLPTPTASVREGTKTARVLEMLRGSKGATLQELMRATNWQRHSVRGFISGQLGKKMGLSVRSFERGGERVYSLKG